MTSDQIMGLVRQLVPLIGGILISLGWFSADVVAGWTARIVEVAGPLMAVVGLVWSWFANTKASILASAAKMPEVKKVVLDGNKPESAELSNATPANVQIGS